MIGTVIRIGWLRLRNNPLELILVFVVPVIFFSIFAMIFGKGLGSGQTSAVKVLLVDEDNTKISRRVLEDLRADPGLTDVATTTSLAPDRVDVGEGLLTRSLAGEQVRNGKAKVAIVIEAGFAEAIMFGEGPTVSLLVDTSDEIAGQLTEAVVRQAMGREAGNSAKDRARRRVDLLPDETRVKLQRLLDRAKEEPHQVVIQDVLASGKVNPRISMYAAGIAVLFVLFSAGSAGATLLEEYEAGTLERLLSSQLSLTQLLAGKWLFIATIGLLQMIVMFAWAQFVFGVEFFSHLPGFFAMALPTVAAAASLAILLATICKSRTQLNSVALIVVLTMSALGGSMVPRYIMSDQMRQLGFVTFNAWALEGFEKVFWRDQPISALWLEMSVLIAASIFMLIAARLCARRWEP